MYLQKKKKNVCVCLKSCQGDLNAAAAAAAVVQISTLEEAIFLTFVWGESHTESAQRQFSLSGAAAVSKHTTSFALVTQADGRHAGGERKKAKNARVGTQVDGHNDQVRFIRDRERGRETPCSQPSCRHGNTAVLSPGGEACVRVCVSLQRGFSSVSLSLHIRSSSGDSHQ